MISKICTVRRGMVSTILAVLLVILFVQGSAAAPKAQSTTQEQAVSEGSPENGRALFVEDIKLENGGPACVGCHTVSDVGILGGGVLGPDLTNIYERYGEFDLVAALSDIAFPTMQPIYEDHPLIESEVADLVAFFASIPGEEQADKEIYLLAASLAGFAGAMLVAGFYWRGRLGRVRKTLVERAQSKSKKS